MCGHTCLDCVVTCLCGQLDWSLTLYCHFLLYRIILVWSWGASEAGGRSVVGYDSVTNHSPPQLTESWQVNEW
jgi:hypothetical protein